MAEADGVTTVVDGLPFIEKGNELNKEGNAKFKAKEHKEAISFYERAIAVLDKADGQPMLRKEVEEIGTLRASLHNKVAQCTALAEADGVNSVVDGLPFIEKGNELKNEGNAKFKAKEHSEAISFYERAIAVLDKADGHPMLRKEVEDIVTLKASLYNNVAQCNISLKFWRRAIEAATACLKLDANNAKALHRRSQAYEHLRKVREAVADVRKLQEAGCGTLKPEEVEAKRAELQAIIDAEEKAKAEEESEDEDGTALVDMKKRFDEVVAKYDLQDGEAACEVADWFVSGEWLLTTKKIAQRWQMEEEDANAFLRWIAKGLEFQTQNATNQAEYAARGPSMAVD